MTEVISNGISRAAYLSTYVVESFLRAVKSIVKSIEVAQTTKAEFEVAKMLHSEYKGESFDYIYTMVREGRADEIGK